MIKDMNSLLNYRGILLAIIYCDTRSHLVGVLLILLVYILRRYLVANTERMFVMTKLIFICWQENVSEYDARQTVANTATFTGRPPHSSKI